MSPLVSSKQHLLQCIHFIASSVIFDTVADNILLAVQFNDNQYKTDGDWEILIFSSFAKGVSWIDDAKEMKSDRVWDDNLLVFNLFMHVSNSWENFGMHILQFTRSIHVANEDSKDLIQKVVCNCELPVTKKELYPNLTHLKQQNLNILFVRRWT